MTLCLLIPHDKYLYLETHLFPCHNTGPLDIEGTLHELKFKPIYKAALASRNFVFNLKISIMNMSRGMYMSKYVSFFVYKSSDNDYFYHCFCSFLRLGAEEGNK